MKRRTKGGLYQRMKRLLGVKRGTLALVGRDVTCRWCLGPREQHWKKKKKRGLMAYFEIKAIREQDPFSLSLHVIVSRRPYDSDAYERIERDMEGHRSSWNKKQCCIT